MLVVFSYYFAVVCPVGVHSLLGLPVCLFKRMTVGMGMGRLHIATRNYTSPEACSLTWMVPLPLPQPTCSWESSKMFFADRRSSGVSARPKGLFG